jgi:UDP-N-acetylmuramoylalanine--D-glutamate ligase|tara:strand:+ start:6782 stop:8080 length:1299 start_codon:yes stop_codon:yes gene_type:complete
MNLTKNFRKKVFAIYGLGSTGNSVINFFKKNKIKKYYMWDDDIRIRRKFKILNNNKTFSKKLDSVDFIVMSPGINIKNISLKKKLKKFQKKIITDLDIFYMREKIPKSIVVTGTNGKSTTCKMLEHILIKNNINAKLGGNIGRPILSINNKKIDIFIIEASSYQLAYSKFIKPDYALILNISKDHLDWHGNVKNYVRSKLKIFSLQDNKCFALLHDKKLIKKFKTSKNKGNLKLVSQSSYNKIKNKIKNLHIRSNANEKNMPFICLLSKILKIREKSLINSLNSFKGLPHRNEIFFRTKNLTFINDSKATTFESSKCALESNTDILWIVGGLAKVGDKLYLEKLKKNIIKSYVIGKNIKYFTNFLKNKVTYEVTRTIKNSLFSIFKKISQNPNKKFTILLSPASASFDQYDNFVDRGNEFKKTAKLYANKYF